MPFAQDANEILGVLTALALISFAVITILSGWKARRFGQLVLVLLGLTFVFHLIPSLPPLVLVFIGLGALLWMWGWIKGKGRQRQRRR